jgi:hypothetical protein
VTALEMSTAGATMVILDRSDPATVRATAGVAT